MGRSMVWQIDRSMFGRTDRWKWRVMLFGSSLQTACGTLGGSWVALWKLSDKLLGCCSGSPPGRLLWNFLGLPGIFSLARGVLFAIVVYSLVSMPKCSSSSASSWNINNTYIHEHTHNMYTCVSSVPSVQGSRTEAGGPLHRTTHGLDSPKEDPFAWLTQDPAFADWDHPGDLPPELGQQEVDWHDVGEEL